MKLAVLPAATLLFALSFSGAYAQVPSATEQFQQKVIDQARAQLPDSSFQAVAWITELQTSIGTDLNVRAMMQEWIKNGLDKQRLVTFIQGASDKKFAFQRLQQATRGLYQQYVVLDDYARIPGVAKQRFVSNGIRPYPIAAKEFGVDSAVFDLPADNAFTFSQRPKLVEIKPGEKLYRVTNDSISDKYAKGGSYWTRTPPQQLADVIGGTAVMPEWNNFQRVYEFTAPAYADTVQARPKFYVWEGPAAAQGVSGIYCDKTDNGYCLPGGSMQIFVPLPRTRPQRYQDFLTHIRDVTPTYKKW